jgi:hypothetical protein
MSEETDIFGGLVKGKASAAGAWLYLHVRIIEVVNSSLTRMKTCQ